MIEHEPWWEEVVGDLVEILLELGETGCALRTLDFYCDPARARRWQVGPLVEMRCRALLSAAEGDLRAALDQLDAAIDGPVAYPWSADLGRALLARGSLRRVLAHTYDARTDLKRALAIFTRHGLATWHAATLRALVGTVSDPDPWTPTAPARVISTLTGGHWDDHEIATRLHLSLVAVQREMGGTPPLGFPAAGSF